MKVETEELADGQVALSFEIDQARFERALGEASRRAASRVRIAGFRPGKAPRALVERVVGRESLLEDALDSLLPEVYREALEETEVRALTPPEFDVQSLDPLRAKATVVVAPPVRLGDYASLRHEPPSVSVTQDQIDAVVQGLREEHAQWVPVDRSAALGDRVAMDVVGLCEGRIVLQREDVEYVLAEEGPSPAPGFAEEVVGMGAGEVRSFELTLPADYQPDTLAGKVVAFRVETKDVKAKELPELDDAFATTVGPHVDVAELRAHVESQLREEGEAAARRELVDKLVEEAVSGSAVQIPPKLIDRETERVGARFGRNLDSLGMSREQYVRWAAKTEAEMEEQFRSQAETQLRRSFVLQAIAAQEGLQVDEEQVDGMIRALALAEGGVRDPHSAPRNPHSALRNPDSAIRKEPDFRERVRSSLLEDKAVQWLVDHATAAASEAVAEGGQGDAKRAR